MKIRHFFCTNKGSIYNLNVAQQYMKANIKKYDWGSYVIANYYPKQIRDDFYTLQWFNIELMRIPESVRESSLAQNKLLYWSENLNQIYQDKPPKEPLSICLHAMCKKNKLSKILLQRIIDARVLEASTPQISNFTQLELFASSIRSNQFLLQLQLLQIDINNPDLIKACEHIGIAVGIVDFIKRVPFSLKKYRLYLPQEVMDKHNVSIRTLWERIEGKPKDELFDVILEVAAFARQHMMEAKKYQDKLPKQAFRAFLHGVEIEYYLEQLEIYNFNVFDKNMLSHSYVTFPMRVFSASKKQKFLYRK